MAPAVSEQQEAVVPAVCELQGAYRDPVTLQGQSESSSQPIAVSEWPKTTHSGRVVEASVLEGLPYGNVEGASQK